MQLLRGRTTHITTLAISPDSRFVVAACMLAECHVWDLFDAEPRPRKLRPDGSRNKLAFSSAITLNDFVSEQWWRYDLAAGTQVPMAFPEEVDQRDAILHPSGEFFKVFSQDGQLMTIRVADDWIKVVKEEAQSPFDLLTFDPTGLSYLAEHAEPDGGESYHLRDTASDRVVTTFDLPRESGDFDTYVFTPDASKLYVFTRHHVTIYPCPAGGPPVLDFALPKDCTLYALAVHPGGRVVATVEDMRTVTLRDADTLQPLRSYDFAMPKVTCVAFTPDGTRCVVGNSRGKVLLFDVE